MLLNYWSSPGLQKHKTKSQNTGQEDIVKLSLKASAGKLLEHEPGQS